MTTTPRAGGPARRLTFVVPGRLDTRTGGYGYDRRLIAGLRALGWIVDVRELHDGFPFPSAAALEDAARVLRDIASGTMVIVDGLALGAMPGVVEPHADRLTVVALVHHPLALETGLDASAATALRVSEWRALRVARAVIVTSRATADLLDGYDVPASRIVVAEPGTDPAPVAAGPIGGECLRLLTVATVVPRKGHETLVQALATLRHHRWRLTCVGSLTRHPDTVRRLTRQIDTMDLRDHIFLAGELDDADLAACYAAADLFVLPTFYEGYGMAVAEALAHGLPVIATATGGIDDLIGTDGAGLIVPPGDAVALAAALARVMDDASLLSGLREGALRTRQRLPGWERTAARVSDALVGVIADAAVEE